MNLFGLRSISLQPLVPPPPRLTLLLTLYYVCLVLCSISVRAVAATSEEAAGSTAAPNETQPVHIVAQFPPLAAGQTQRTHLDYNATSLRFNHLVIDPKTGQLFAGAVNRLLQLDSDLKLKENVITGKNIIQYQLQLFVDINNIHYLLKL